MLLYLANYFFCKRTNTKVGRETLDNQSEKLRSPRRLKKHPCVGEANSIIYNTHRSWLASREYREIMI